MKMDNSASSIDYSTLESVEDVAKTLDELDQKLGASEVKDLQNFNKAYYIITKNVKGHMEKGGFEYPDFLNKFDVRFVIYYLEAFWSYLNKKPTPPAWRIAFDKCKKGQASPFIYMSLGINAHINNDIPQALKDCAAKECHYQDYVKVNDIIHQSIYEVIDSLKDDDSIITPKRTALKPAYKAGMNALVHRWRKNAWERFRLLQKGRLTRPELEKIAHDQALELLKLPI